MPDSTSRRGFAERHWYRLSPLSAVLLPLSLCYGALVWLRRGLYRLGLLRRHRLPVPVVIVGNLTAGGTGKTPLVLWLAESLRAAGRYPGIVLRGYGAALGTPRLVMASDAAAEAGDEALLLAQRSGCPVWAGRDRVAAARGLLAAHPQCDVILCDDGLQHYRLERDLEIAVEDERGAGNGLLIPAGPLREPRRRVAAVVLNGGVGQARTARADRVFAMQLKPAGLEKLDGTPVGTASLMGQSVHAVAGIGNPQRFFRTLSALGLDFTPHPFPDHHAFSEADLRFGDAAPVLMTEKDAVKCRAFATAGMFFLPVRASIDPALVALLEDRLHGPEAA